MILSLGLAALAAIGNAGSNVLQRQANMKEPEELSLSPKLILALLHRKEWWAGIALVTGSFVCQASALGAGELAVVQPVIVLELPITLIAAGAFFHFRLGRREWAAIALLTLGVAGVIGFLSPQGGRMPSGAFVWAVGAGGTAALIAVLVLLGRVHYGDFRAALYGSAAGITFGLTAAFMKAMTNQLSTGFFSVFSSWAVYAMVATGLLGMFLIQSAFQAGRLVASQPGLSLLDPFWAVGWGVLVFHEQTNKGWFVALAAMSAMAMAIGAVALSSSSALQHTRGKSGSLPKQEAMQVTSSAEAAGEVCTSR
jgi:drug/metabolite transporter (DMT)-like permease